MSTTAKNVSLKALADQAMDETYSQEPTLTRTLPWSRVCMATGLNRLVQKSAEVGNDMHWVFSDLAVHLDHLGERVTEADIEAFPHLPTFQKCWEKWEKSYKFHQTYTLMREGRGATLYLHGGTTVSEDHSEELYPVQSYDFARIPWGKDKEFTFFVGPWWDYETKQQLGWIACLPAER